MALQGTAVQDDEQSLVARAQRGDNAAFEALVHEHQRVVFAFAWRRLRDVDEARELAQRVFVRAFEKLSAFRGEARFRTWLLSIAVRLMIDGKRAQAREVPVVEVATPASDAVEQRQQASLLRAAIATLPEKQRLVVELRAYDELSFREIGDVLGISEDAAKTNFHHALKKLRAEMEQGR